MIEVTSFGGQNWLITPAALAANEAPPRSINDQKWLLVLSGVGICNATGQAANDWKRGSVHIFPDIESPINFALDTHAIPRPPQGSSYLLSFALEQWSPYSSISSIFDQSTAVNAGFAVDDWRPSPFGTGTNVLNNQPVAQLFNGIVVDIAVRDVDAYLYRVGYNITLLGRIVFLENTIF